MPRRRKRLVPEDCVEVFEVRMVSYFDQSGKRWTAIEVSNADEDGDYPNRPEVLGTVMEGIDLIKDTYVEDD